MKDFKDFGIKPAQKAFTGDKMKMSKVLNLKITVLDFRIDDSKFKSNEDCLCIHFELNGEKHVVFTGSKILTQMIKQVATTDFPFVTTIIEKDEQYQFS